MALQVGIVGLPRSGKTTLFNVLTRAGVGLGEFGKEHVGMAPIPDERLERVAAVVGALKVTPAAIRLVDVPGTGAAQLGNVRRSDAIVAVVDGFSPGGDAARDLANLELELLIADRDHVERRLERISRQAKSGDPALRRQVEQLGELLAHLDGGGSFCDWPRPLPPELEPLTTKPLLTVENGPAGIDLELEAELAELPDEEAAAFRDGPSALAAVVRRLFESLDLLSFFTADEKETRAWTLRRGQTALDAAATIHSDLARGFIRCEVIRWDDLVECGSDAEARRRGLERLEGKTYQVRDGDVVHVRFSV